MVKFRKNFYKFPWNILGLDDEESTNIGGGMIGLTDDPNLIWPSMQDLNTRLRRVITSYQRNYKKEELKQQQKAKVCYILYVIAHPHWFPTPDQINSCTEVVPSEMSAKYQVNLVFDVRIYNWVGCVLIEIKYVT